MIHRSDSGSTQIGDGSGRVGLLPDRVRLAAAAPNKGGRAGVVRDGQGMLGAERGTVGVGRGDGRTEGWRGVLIDAAIVVSFGVKWPKRYGYCLESGGNPRRPIQRRAVLFLNITITAYDH